MTHSKCAINNESNCSSIDAGFIFYFKIGGNIIDMSSEKKQFANDGLYITKIK